jgi:hypothetical protein
MKKIGMLVYRLTNGAIALSMVSGTAFAGAGATFMSSVVGSLDPAIQPYAKIIADNIVLVFNLVIVCGILGYGALSAIQKKQGHTSQAADSKATAWDVFKKGAITLILFNVFVALVGRFGP